MAVSSDILKVKLEALLGERGNGKDAAVRRSEIDALLDKAAAIATVKAEKAAKTAAAEAITIARRAESKANAATEAASTQATAVSQDETNQNERLFDAISELFQWSGSSYTLRVPADGVIGKIVEQQIAEALILSLNYVGEFASAPAEIDLGANWKQNSVYKNTTDGISYILTGSPLAWVRYVEDGKAHTMVVESSNGNIFRVGAATTTTLKARVFKNGAEIGENLPAGWFKWRRVSAISRPYPHDDDTWNAVFASGYRQITIDVDDIYARATFFCEIHAT